MAKRIKKPPVEMEKRQDWLKRYELGESPPHIAQTDGFDPRTVRVHIEKAKQEREVKEARSMVLRNALESHYNDLCKYAEKLSALVRGESAAELPREEYIHSALRQHIPRSPIWNYLKQRDALKQQIDSCRRQIGNKIEEMVKSNKQLSSHPDLKEIVAFNIVGALKFQVSEWLQKRQELTVNAKFFEQDAGEFINLHYGDAHLGNIEKGKKEDIERVKKVVADLEERIRQSEEYKKIERLYTDLRGVESKLKEELAVITLRRVVPGRCRYCPL